MFDSYSRHINYLRISVTDRCNLRCRYCMPEQGVPAIAHGDVLSYEEMLRVARVAVELGVRKIRLTGGEPLVRKGLVDFVAALADLPHQPELTLTTNGLLLAENARALKRAGLSRVNVSLDSLQPERFQQLTRRSGLERVWAGVQAAADAGLTPIKINMVPIQGVNSDEVAAFAQLTYEHPWQIRFIEFMPVSSGLGFSPAQLYPADSIKNDLREFGPLIPVDNQTTHGPARIYRLPGAVGTIGIIHAVSQMFCRECNRLRLTADGQLRPCLLCDHELDLRKMIRSGVDDRSLAELLKRSVAEKPEQHCLSRGDHSGARAMTGIGG